MKKNYVIGLIIIVLMFLPNCKTKHYFQKRNKMDISLNCDIENNRVKLRFTSMDSDTVHLFSPCLTNTFVYLKNKNIELEPKILFKKNCNTELFYLSNTEPKDFFYPYCLDELFELVKGQEYDIRIEYYVYEEGKVIQKFETSCVFVW